MTENGIDKKTPNESLADLVVEKLKEKGFVPDGKAVEITTKLSSGTATSEDWKLWVDLAQSKKQRGGENAQD